MYVGMYTKFDLSQFTGNEREREENENELILTPRFS